jgi:DNA-binding MarR family transcriptional regulator
LRIDKGAVARAVQKFVNGGYVTRVLSEEDRRQYCIFPTDKMKAIYHAVRKVEADWEEHVTRNLSPDERKTLISLLDRILSDME